VTASRPWAKSSASIRIPETSRSVGCLDFVCSSRNGPGSCPVFGLMSKDTSEQPRSGYVSRDKRSPRPSKSATPKLPKLKPHSVPSSKLSGGILVTTATLTRCTCKWPIGDPAEPTFHYCGDQTVPGTPYCELHDKRGYLPLAPRRIITPSR
jgi:hypothetical protein